MWKSHEQEKMRGSGQITWTYYKTLYRSYISIDESDKILSLRLTQLYRDSILSLPYDEKDGVLPFF